MIQVRVVAVGKPRTPGFGRAIEEYEARLGHYFRFEAVEVRPAALPDARADEAREREAAGLADRLPPELELIALTREGTAWSTRRLAGHLEDMQTYGRPGAAFAIGGAHGLAPSLLEAARHRLSLSSMTLPHELARLVLTEQLYRAGTLLRGEPYHKGP